MEDRQQGVTVLELLLAMMVAAILATVAIPAWESASAYGRGAAEMNRFAADLAYARSAAIARGHVVALCTSRDGHECSTSPWDDGWIVYADADNDRKREADEPLLREEDGFDSPDRLEGNRLVAHRLAFRRDGLPRGLHNGTVTFTPRPDRQALHRCLIIARTGRVRAEEGSDCP